MDKYRVRRVKGNVIWRWKVEKYAGVTADIFKTRAEARSFATSENMKLEARPQEKRASKLGRAFNIACLLGGAAWLYILYQILTY